jgi:hypothetical protein
MYTLSGDSGFPGTNIQNNLADKARKLGIKPYDFRKKGGA